VFEKDGENVRTLCDRELRLIVMLAKDYDALTTNPVLPTSTVVLIFNSCTPVPDGSKISD
jgi:hypothetical protein